MKLLELEKLYKEVDNKLNCIAREYKDGKYMLCMHIGYKTLPSVSMFTDAVESKPENGTILKGGWELTYNQNQVTLRDAVEMADIIEKELQ